MRSVAFQSILRKRIRKLPKFLKILKIIQFYSILFNRVLNHARAGVHLLEQSFDRPDIPNVPTRLRELGVGELAVAANVEAVPPSSGEITEPVDKRLLEALQRLGANIVLRHGLALLLGLRTDVEFLQESIVPLCPVRHGYFGPGTPQTVKFARSGFFGNYIWPPSFSY